MDSLQQFSPPVNPATLSPDDAALLTRAVWLSTAPPARRNAWTDAFSFAMAVRHGDTSYERHWGERDHDNAARMAALLACAIASVGNGASTLRRRLLWSMATTLKCIASHRRAHGLPRRGFTRVGRPVFGGAR